MASDERDMDWGEDTCHLCKDSTWLSLVLYEPIGVETDETEQGKAFISSHPAPQDERPIAVCGNCLSEAQQTLGSDAPFTELQKYLIYLVYPEYVEELHPGDAERFSQLLD
jgi:hypothetical protein